MNRFLRFISRFLPVKRVVIDGVLYLERFYLFGPDPYWTKPRLRWFPTVYLHCFHSPDGDRELHNHPWDVSRSLILSGGYREARLCRPFVHHHIYGPWEFNVIKRSTFHRVTHLLAPQVWTLFMPGKRVGRWGFLNEKGEFRFYEPARNPGNADQSERATR